MPTPREVDCYEALIAQLRARREALGISQTELDERIGLTRGHIGEYERGRRRPTGFNLSCWCYALGGYLTFQSFQGGTNARSADKPRGVRHRQPAAAAASSL